MQLIKIGQHKVVYKMNGYVNVIHLGLLIEYCVQNIRTIHHARKSWYLQGIHPSFSINNTYQNDLVGPVCDEQFLIVDACSYPIMQLD